MTRCRRWIARAGGVVWCAAVLRFLGSMGSARGLSGVRARSILAAVGTHQSLTSARLRSAFHGAGRRIPPGRDSSGQALLLVLGVLLAAALGALVLGGIPRGIGDRGDRQRAADLAALAAARAMHDAYDGVFEPASVDGRDSPRHLERDDYLALGRHAALATAAANGARDIRIAFPGGGLAPVRVRVTVRDPIEVGAGRWLANAATAEAQLAPDAMPPAGDPHGAGEYRGPFAFRQGKRMRPDVAQAFDRLERAAGADGVELIITSAFRGDAEQARLFAAHPDPKWVARPGQSLHRLGTELDLGPRSALGRAPRQAPRLYLLPR